MAARGRSSWGKNSAVLQLLRWKQNIILVVIDWKQELIPSLQEGHMLLVYYGSLAVLVFKCGTQLLKEANYRVKMKKAEF